MIGNLRLYFLLATILLLTTCYGKSERSRVKILVKTNDFNSVMVQITTANLVSLDSNLLAKTQSDSLGNAILSFDLNRAVFAYVAVKDLFIPIYVSPGNQIQITLDSHTKNIQITGDGSKIHEFLRLTDIVKRKYETVDGKHYTQIEPHQFVTVRDSAQKAYNSLLETLQKDTGIGKEVIEVMAIKNKLSLYGIQKNYVAAKFGQNSNDPAIPESVGQNLNNFPLDTIALRANIFDYGVFLSGYLNSTIYAKISKDQEKMDPDSLSRMLPLLAENKIKEGNYPQSLKDFLLAKNIHFWVNMYGLSPELEIAHQNFLKEVGEPLYRSTVKKSFVKWLALAPGKPAPDFAGITADGKKISLSDLKGKIVYMDVWATWCAPCRAEFADSKKVMEAFKGESKIAFLFVSIDKNIADWQKLLPDTSIPKGIHMNQVQNKQPDALWESYYIWGIPRYILIDADGKMVRSHASRPSSGKVEGQLRALLEKNF